MLTGISLRLSPADDLHKCKGSPSEARGFPKGFWVIIYFIVLFLVCFYVAV